MGLLFKVKLFYHRFINVEYWPAWTIYFPMGFYFLYLIIKNKSCGFYAAVNPGILYGGITLEGKNEVDKLLPIDFIPKSILIIPGTPMNIIKLLMEDGGIKIPCYVKPDNG